MNCARRRLDGRPAHRRAAIFGAFGLSMLLMAPQAAAQTMTMDEILEELRRGAPRQPDGPPTTGDAAASGDTAAPPSATGVPTPVDQPPSPIPTPDLEPGPGQTPLQPVPMETRLSPQPRPQPSPTAPPTPAPRPIPAGPISAPPPQPSPSPTRRSVTVQRRPPAPPIPRPQANQATRARVSVRYPWYIQHQIVAPPVQAVRGDIATRLGGPPAPVYPAPAGPQQPPSRYDVGQTGQGGYVYPIRGRRTRPGYSPVQPRPLPPNVVAAEPYDPANNALIVGPAATQVARAVAVEDGEEEENLAPLLQAVRAGILRHDAAFFGMREEEGFDINGELLFRPFNFMKPIGAPRPIFGMSINTAGYTNQIYAGFSWQWEDVIFDNLFVGFSLGFALHDGDKTRFDPEDIDRGKEFGLRLLFRESVEIGYRITPTQSLSLMLDHISNANIADANEGMDGLGIRYGYRF